MNLIELLEKIQHGDLADSAVLGDMFEIVRLLEKEGEFFLAHEKNKDIRRLSAKYAIENRDSKMYELNRRSLLFDAQIDFDAYLQYLEIDRKSYERFYLPRRSVMKQLVDEMQNLADGKLDELFISMPPRVGKALANDTPILTTNGWGKHGDLKVGDTIFSPDGKTTKVLAVHPKCKITHKVKFTDGSEFLCHFRHEWKVYDRRRRKVRILETNEMIGNLDNGRNYGHKRGHRYNFQLLKKSVLGLDDETKNLRSPLKFGKQRWIAIKEIVEIPENEQPEGNCITVENDGMYLVGHQLIPTHNTTLLMLFVTWIAGRDSERSNLYSAYSDSITTAFYNGCLEIMTDSITYKWSEIFPAAKIVSTSARDETLNVDRKKRYPSLTCRSLYGTLNGACDCNGMLISDDLIGGIEEAMNKDRLISAWSKVDNNLIPRAKENAKMLWCGTRWSIVDPAGVRMDLLLNDERYKGRKYKIINLPALDEEEHSNFHYLYGVGFSDEYYYMRRASFERNNDMASWMAQYMGEPVERSGALFEPEDMRFYNGNLPEGNPVRIFMAVDAAYGGGDFTSAPILYQYENGDIYVHDVVFNDGDKRITQPLIIKKIKQHGIQAARFEANKSTSGYKDDIEARLKQDGYKMNIETRPAPTHTAKDMRIKDRAPEIRDFFFLEDGKRHKEYSAFMTNLYSYKLIGKNKHDDAPDSLAQAVDMIVNPNKVVSIFKRGY